MRTRRTTDPGAASAAPTNGRVNEPVARLRGAAPGKDRLCLFLLVFLVAAIPLAAQGTPSPWSSVKSFPHGWVDRSGLDVHLEFPLFSAPGLGRAHMDAKLVYDSDDWVFGGSAWSVNPDGGWRQQTGPGAQLLVHETSVPCYFVYRGQRSRGGTVYKYNYSLLTPDGNTFNVSYATRVDADDPPAGWTNECPKPQPPSPPTAVVQASRDSYTVTINPTTYAGSVYDSEGDAEGDGGLATPQGNAVTVTSGSGTTTYTDPLGATLTVASADEGFENTYTYTGPNGTATVTEELETVSATGSFGCGTGGSASLTEPYSLTYPDGEVYKFAYDSAGRLTTLTLPTGGTITFAAGESCLSGTITKTLSRTDSLAPSHPWSWSASGPDTEDGIGSTIETSPDGNDTSYDFDLTAEGAPILTGWVHYLGPYTNYHVLDQTGITNTSLSGGGLERQFTTTIKAGNGAPSDLDMVHTAEFDEYGKPTFTSTTAWSTAPGGGALLRETTDAYTLNQADYADQQTNQTLFHFAAGNPVTEAETQYNYNGAGEISSVQQLNNGNWLTTQSLTYNTNGTVASATGINGAATSYTYNACNGTRPTLIQSAIAAVKTTLAWNCTGEVETSSTDGNGFTTSFGYGDGTNTWRPTSVTRPDGSTTTTTVAINSTPPSTIKAVTTLSGGASANCGTSAGNLAERVDANGSITCYTYDALQRVLSATFTAGANPGESLEPVAAAPTETFVYGAATVDGAAMQNAVGRLAEAYTGSHVTDEGFSYPSPDAATLYQLTAGNWYITSSTYYPNGALDTLAVPGVPTITYTLDGEGRPKAVAAPGPVTLASGVAYDAASQVTNLTLGSGDTDTYTYDPNTGRMKTFAFSVGAGTPPPTDTGALTWNNNGSLHELNVQDGISGAGDSQDCTYLQDDLGRLHSVTCTGGPAWAQTFSYDPFGNINKSGSQSFDASYNTDNRITADADWAPTYDNAGDLISDPVTEVGAANQFDAAGHPTTFEGQTMAFDALGRPVEAGGQEFIWGPGGAKLAVMSGTTLERAEIPLPGGGAAVYNAGGLEYYRHADWLGTARLESTPQRTLYAATAYAPTGIAYNAAGPQAFSFTGKQNDVSNASYDFPFRELSAIQGRWWRPDPAALAAANPNDPQTWDAYSYVGDNPMFLTDPWGLHAVQCYVDGKTTSESSAEACYKAGGMLVQPQSVTVTPGESEGPDLEPLFTLTFYGPTGLPTETSLVRTTLTGPTNRLTLILPSNPSGRACGGILAKGAVQTGLDAAAAIPVAGEAAATLHVAQATLEVVHSSAVVGSMAMSVATADATGSAIGGTGIGIELVKQNAPALVLDTGEAIPVLGRGLAALAIVYDSSSTAWDYGVCRGWVR